MPQSGIKPTDEVKIAYQQVNKSGKGIPYAVFKFSENVKHVVVDEDPKFYSTKLHYNELIELMPGNEPRFIAYEFPFVTKSTGQKNKTPILVSWFPTNCLLRLKFLVGSTFLALRDDLGASKYIEGEDTSELNELAVCSKFDWTPLADDQKEDFGGQSVDVNKSV